jgi:xanthine dehydrogenase accessory factor
MSDFITISEAALAALAAGEMVCLCTVVRARGSVPRHAGARMLVWADGRILGTVGGATLEQEVIAAAKQVLRDGRSQLVNYVFSTHKDDPDSVGLCGGAVDVHIELLQPDPVLLIIGAGHVAMPLAQMGAAIGMKVWIVDDRAEYVTPERFPTAERLEVVAYDAETETLADLPLLMGSNTYIVVATWGWDEPVLAQILRHPVPYAALVASETKARVIRGRLIEQGLTPEQAAFFRAPAGLDLGAETPAEIALSILSEILAVRQHGSAQAMFEMAGEEKRPFAASKKISRANN